MGEGRFFEDFALGQTFNHPPARTVSDGDASLHLALTGSRFPLHCSAPFAQRLGLPRAPLDDFLVFNLVFGQTVADISLNAVANLGYACGLFGSPVYAGDTLLTSSIVTGLRQTSAGDAGLVYVHTKSVAQDGRNVLSFDRWVMVKKRDHALPAPTPVVPTCAPLVPKDYARLDLAAYDFSGTGSALRASELKVGQQIDHVFGMTVEEAEHQLATRLYQNPARLHVEAPLQQGTRFGRRLVYGGYLIALARALSFNGLQNAVRVLAIHSGRHAAPFFAGDTLYAGSKILDVSGDLVRLSLLAMKNKPFSDGFPEAADPTLVLELEMTVQLPA